MALSSAIGRGHPNYLRSVLSFLPAVPEINASGLGWTFARWLYRTGAQNQTLINAYNRLRFRTKISPLTGWLFKPKIPIKFRDYSGIFLVDHPLLAQCLAPYCRTAYLHGEIAAPSIAAVPSVWCTFVPIPFTFDTLVSLGVNPARLFISGLVIEPEIISVAKSAYELRLNRYESSSPLTVAFFTSGAYPLPHLRAIKSAARSLQAAGHRTLIFAGTDLTHRKLLPDALFFKSHQEENQKTAALITRIDLFVAAAHERVNWAVGIGLPMFALLPHIGPFAGENFTFAFQQGVCLPLTHPANFATQINHLRRTGKLTTMAKSGWGKFPIYGAERIAQFLQNNFSC